MNRHHIHFLDAQGRDAFIKDNPFISHVKDVDYGPFKFHQIVRGEDVFGKSGVSSHFVSERELGAYHGVTDRGLNPIKSLSSSEEEKYGIQTESLNY